MKQELKDIASILSTVLDFVGNGLIVDRRLAESYHSSFKDAREKLKLLTEPEPEYRMLEVGEVIQSGDEVRIGTLWRAITKDCFGEHIRHSAARPFPAGYYRRPVANDSIIKPELKLEAGKKYVLRNGDVVGPLKLSPLQLAFPFMANGLSWKANGDFLSAATHTHDIVSEYVEPEYRILNPGELVQKDDEYSTDNEKWERVNYSGYQNLVIRRRIN